MLELRRMFSARDRWVRQAVEYHRDQVKDHIARQDVPLVVAHVLPLGRLDDILRLRDLQEAVRAMMLPLMYRMLGSNDRFTGNGYRVQYEEENRLISSCELLRSGGFEGYADARSRYIAKSSKAGGARWTDAGWVTEDLLYFALRGSEHMRDIVHVNPPLVFLATMHGFQGTRLTFMKGSERVASPTLSPASRSLCRLCC